jgi:GNAT superfamily N-acetyltransferase
VSEDPGLATIRAAREDDLEAIDTVLLAHDEPTEGPPLRSGAYRGYLRHLLARGTIVVAESGDGIVGFGSSVDTGRAIHLSDLFVIPGLLGRGVGRRLLEPLFPGSTPRTTFASDDPRAMHLYVGLGMTPLWTNFYVTGTCERHEPPGDIAAADASADEVAVLEREWTGVDRSADYALWAARPGHRPFVIRAGGRPIAAGHSRPRMRGTGRWLDRLIPAAGAGDEDLTAAILAALAHAASDDGEVGTCVMGTNPAFRTLLVDHRFRILDRDTFMATDPSLLDPRGLYDTGIP